MLAKSFKNLFFLILICSESQFSLTNEIYAKLKINFTSSRMEKFTLKAASVILFDPFQIIIAGEYYVQISFDNVTSTFTYAIAQIISSRTLVSKDTATLDLKLHNSHTKFTRHTLTISIIF